MSRFVFLFVLVCSLACAGLPSTPQSNGNQPSDLSGQVQTGQIPLPLSGVVNSYHEGVSGLSREQAADMDRIQSLIGWAGYFGGLPQSTIFVGWHSEGLCFIPLSEQEPVVWVEPTTRSSEWRAHATVLTARYKGYTALTVPAFRGEMAEVAYPVVTALRNLPGVVVDTSGTFTVITITPE